MTQPTTPALEMWGGVECTVNRVGDRWWDQLVWSGHDTRDEDLARFAALGIRTLRYPVLWERVAPERPDLFEWDWTDRRLARLRELGVEPVAGLLHHGSGPRYTSLVDPDFPEKLASYAARVAERYPWVARYTPVNEPLTTARFSGLYGHWYPHGRSDDLFVRALLNQLRGVVLAMRAVRQVNPLAQLVQTEDCGCTFGRRQTRGQVLHERHRRWLTFDLLTGRVDESHPLHAFLRARGMTDADEQFFRESDVRPDIIGLNYYLTSDRYLDERLERYPAERHGGNGIIRYADVEAVRARPGGIAGHERHLIDAWRHYQRPVAITEVHLGCTRDEQLRWLVESWGGASRAREKGADVRAVTAWALLGSYNWESLVTRDEGRYEPGAFDVRAPAPRATAVGAAISELAAGRAPAHPVLRGTPWWRRPDRVGHGAPSRRATPGGGAPLLVTGANGTLGRAVARICRERGLATCVLSRTELDITNPSMVDATFRRVEPWAVVNAAGYVRVDEAEAHAAACRRANVVGPATLAAACHRHAVPLVTFSSDLVFDGVTSRPYVEGDDRAPLNVYGATKAEAEACVLDLLPAALVIRTSAFFGPWDDGHFLAQAFRTLDRGQAFHAPTDAVVSPTYVPDLVHASLDLLIDGESGLWHLANEGALSWFEFAREAAARSGRDVDLVIPARSEDVWRPARRPRDSSLSSERGRLMRPLADALDAFIAEAGRESALGEALGGCVR